MPSALNFTIANPGGTSAPSTPHDPARAAFEQDQEERVGLVGKGKGKEPAREFAGRGVCLWLDYYIIGALGRFCVSSTVLFQFSSFPLVYFISVIHFLLLFHLHVYCFSTSLCQFLSSFVLRSRPLSSSSFLPLPRSL
jgi:hypothetical protein